METQRFDELTVALVRGGSRRGVLRGLAGGVFGALALDRSRALAKNGDAKGGGKPITNPAKPVCPRNKTTVNCPTCYEARYGPDGPNSLTEQGCCKDPSLGGKEQDCSACEEVNASYCGSTINDGGGTCVTATCAKDNNRCDYKVNNAFCYGKFGSGWSCCPTFTSPNFGHCINKAAGGTCDPVV